MNALNLVIENELTTVVGLMGHKPVANCQKFLSSMINDNVLSQASYLLIQKGQNLINFLYFCSTVGIRLNLAKLNATKLYDLFTFALIIFFASKLD